MNFKKYFLSLTLAFSCITNAEGYPDKVITLVAPYGTGGASDLVARALADTSRQYLGKEVVVVNKTGNGGIVGSRFVVESDNDGYTLLLARPVVSLYPAVNQKAELKWDDYTFIGALEATPMILAVNSESPYQTATELLDAIKAKPGTMSYAASGPTAIDGLSVQALLSDAGLNPLMDATIVPYRGGNALATALLGNHVDFLAIAAGSLMPHIKSNKMRPLAVLAPKRVESLPDVPTVAELGYEKAGQISGWSALYGPKNLSQEVLNKWNDTLQQVATDTKWLELADSRGSLSIIGEVNMTEFAQKQYELYHSLAIEFGYIK